MGTYYTGILYCIGRYTKPGYLYHTGTGKSWIGASLRDLTMLSVLNINKKSKKKKENVNNGIKTANSRHLRFG